VIESLRPPDLEITPPLRWVLLAAFANTPPGPPEETAVPAIEALVGKLGLTERIAGRQADAVLPEGTRAAFRAHITRSTAISLLYESIARNVARASHRLHAPVAFLKGFALFFLEISPPGSRPFSDLDILTDSTTAEPLWSSLQAEGFDPVGSERTEQHLPGLRSPRGGLLEIHFALRGLVRPDGASICLDDLLGRGALLPLDGYEGRCYVPSTELLAAHILVHGFQQHLLRPRTYPLLRMVADLLDLLPQKRDWVRLRESWEASYVQVVSGRDVEAIEVLCRELSEGRIPGPASRSAHRLLAHIVAGSLDEDYANSLATRYLTSRLADARRRGELAAYLQRKLRPGAQPNGTSDLFGLEEPLGRLGRSVRHQARALFARLRLGRSDR
jgi:hypothetical protein